MYSVDAYVNSEGKAIFCPPVDVLTGRDVGDIDFYGFSRMAPSILDCREIKDLETVSLEALNCLGLRSCSAHIELRRAFDGWKIIEIGPRIGGFRQQIYHEVYGINHIANDISNRLDKKIQINNKPRCTFGVIKIYPERSGILSSINGLSEFIDANPQAYILKQKNIGDKSLKSSEGGLEVLRIAIKANNRDEYLEIAQKALEIKVITT